MTRPRHPATSPRPARRYVWWPLLLCAALLGAVALGMPWPAVLLMLPCAVAPMLLQRRGPLEAGWLAPALRLACLIVPLVVVATLNPRYDRFGLTQGQPGVITPAEFWSHVARAEVAALVLAELALLALAARIDERGRWIRRGHR